MTNSIKIIQPDDWHVHFREDEMLRVVTKYSSRVNRRSIAMPNTLNPITSSDQAVAYKKLIEKDHKIILSSRVSQIKKEKEEWHKNLKIVKGAKKNT